MSTSSRLTEVFLEARKNPIPFDDHARFVFFSDVHRGNNSWADDFARNDETYLHALEQYYRNGFTYFELGDGDELFNNCYFADIHDAHPHVFHMLKKFYEARPGRLHMIYGNHDMERADPAVVARTLQANFRDRRTGRETPLFRGIQVREALVLKHLPSGGEIFLVHGHQGDLFNDRLWKISRYLSRTLWQPLEMLGITEPTSPAKNYLKRGKIEKRIQAWIKQENQPTIFGHTHKPSFAREGEIPFFNIGSCVTPRAITNIEIQAGRIALVKWRLMPDRFGRLRVTREELEKPRAVASLFQ